MEAVSFCFSEKGRVLILELWFCEMTIGNLNQPKWGHLKELHYHIRSMEKVLTYGDVTEVEYWNSLSVSDISSVNKAFLIKYSWSLLSSVIEVFLIKYSWSLTYISYSNMFWFSNIAGNNLQLWRKSILFH